MSLDELIRSSEPLILDGAMGTELEKRKCGGGGLCNLTSPDTVLEIHKEYVRAGSRVLIANTLTMNRLYIETHKLDIDVERVNQAGARLAADAIQGNGYVLGNLSSTGQMLEPYGTFLEDEFIDAFKEQAACLVQAGVAGFIIETMIDLREAVCAVKACKAVSALPVIACMAFFSRTDGGRTAMGNSAEECARVLAAEGAAAIGANCGSIDPEQMAEIVAVMSKSTALPIVAEPNAGKPRLSGTATVFDMDPSKFADGLMACRQAGARILGGCCGTTPHHISEFTRQLKGMA